MKQTEILNRATHVKRWFPSCSHELHQSKFPFVTRIEFIRSKPTIFFLLMYPGPVPSVRRPWERPRCPSAGQSAVSCRRVDSRRPPLRSKVQSAPTPTPPAAAEAAEAMATKAMATKAAEVMALNAPSPWVSFCIGLVGPEPYQLFRNFNIMPMALHGKNGFEVVKINIRALPIIFRK